MNQSTGPSGGRDPAGGGAVRVLVAAPAKFASETNRRDLQISARSRLSLVPREIQIGPKYGDFQLIPRRISECEDWVADAAV